MKINDVAWRRSSTMPPPELSRRHPRQFLEERTKVWLVGEPDGIPDILQGPVRLHQQRLALIQQPEFNMCAYILTRMFL
jgi:hypothetical protein